MGTKVQQSLGTNNIPLVSISNEYGSSSISLLGATLIDWIPPDNIHVIWLSDKSVFKEGKGIRGGIPICWPWFGAHPTQANFPQHGIARTRLWEFTGTHDLPDGTTNAIFTLLPEVETLWPFNSKLELIVTLGKCLQLKLITHNLGDSPFEITQAFHTYFNIGNINEVSVYGLEGRHYLDKPDNFTEKQQSGPIIFREEVDRVYLDTEDTCIVDDPVLERRIEIKKQGSRSTVVWNPWRDNSEKMSDMTSEGYQTMVCVESTNAAADTRIIKPGHNDSIQVSYRVID